MKRLFRFRYPKLALLIFCIILAYNLFKNPDVSNFVNSLGSFGIAGNFFAGMLFSFGFSTPFAIGYFLSLENPNIIFTGVIGGLGALISDLFIFHFIKFSFMDEFTKLENTKIMQEIKNLINYNFGHKIRIYLLYIFSGIIIASPLPDEVGVTMLAGLTHIKPGFLALLSFIFNSLGIIVIISFF